MSATPHRASLARVEQALRARRRVLQGEVREALLRAGSERYADIAGRLQDAQDESLAGILVEVTHADVARDVEEIGDIEGALRRIARGTYGVCVRCGKSIAAARLEAWPTAKRCLRCQRLHEDARSRPGLPGTS